MNKLLTISKLHLGAVPALMAALLVAAPAQARQLTAQEALQSVQGSAATGARRAPAAGELKLSYTAAQDGLNTVYVFNRGTDRGFMFVAADDVVADGLLGYTDSGNFNLEAMPENLRGWLETYSAQIAAAAKSGAKVISAEPRASYSDIAPIVKTHWDQGAPFNDLAPVDDKGYRCYTGCVATAMSQVMKTYNFPEKGIGENSYYLGSLEQTISFDFAKTTFDWANMINDYPGNATQNNAVATLMKAAGVAVDMSYGVNASGAFSGEVPAAIIKYCGYANSAHFSYRKYYSMPVWMDMIYSELSQGYPLYYSGQAADGSGGHAFVLDGYRASDAFVHINWGWGGMSDGYFRITTLDPGMQGAGGAGAGFSDLQGAIFSLRKPYEGSVIFPNLTQDDNLGTKSAEYQRGNSDFVRFTGTVNSSAIADIAVTFGVRLTPAEGGEPVYVWKNGTQTVKPDGKVGQIELRYDAFPTAGKYTVHTVYRYNGEIFEVPIQVGKVRALTLVAEANKLTFAPVVDTPELSATDIQLHGPLYAGKYAKFTAKVTNSGAEYFGKVNLAFVGAGTSTQLYGVIAGPAIDLVEGESEEIEFVGTAPTDILTPNTYVAVVTEAGELLSEKVKFELHPASSVEAKVDLMDQKILNASRGSGISLNPYRVTGNPLSVKGVFKCVAGTYFADAVYFWINAKGSKSWSGTPSDILTIKEGEETTVEINIVDNGFVQGNVYQGTFAFVVDNQFIDFYINPATGSEWASMWFTIDTSAGVDDIVAETESVSVYPNPAVDFVSVEAGAAITSIEVYSLSGSMVLNVACNGASTSEELDVTGLAAGVYVLRANTGAGSVTTRLIKK